jgi:hypothetical protein
MKLSLWATSKRLGIPKAAKAHPVVGPLVALHTVLFREAIKRATSKGPMQYDGLVLANLGGIAYALLVDLELRGWRLVEFKATRIANADYRILFTVEEADSPTP